MKLLSVDMCMEASKHPERIEALGRLVLSRRPEFLALQNVSNETIKKITKTNWGSRYNVSQPPTRFETRGKPTVAIFSTYPAQDVIPVNFHKTTANSLMLVAFFVMYDKQKSPHVISVCSAQLDSGLQHTELREIQLNQALLARPEDQDSFVLGSCGIINEIDGEVQLNSPWRDAWLDVDGHTPKNGDTYVPGVNPLIVDDKLFNGRPDRLLYKTRRYKLDSIEVLGKEVGGSEVSPHFGLFSVFSPLEGLRPPHEEEEVACFFDRPQWSLDFEQKK